MDIRPIRTEADYEWALHEIEQYFDRTAAQAGTIEGAHGDAARTGEQHAVNVAAARDQRCGLDALRKHGERTRIQRVAAQLVTGETRALEDAHPGTGARKNQGRPGASRSAPGNHDVIHESGRAPARCSWSRSPGNCKAPLRAAPCGLRWQ